ncbi:MAG: magnesium transporter, partial [Thermoplasmata archaeon]|nr:magnesium transporter [Thermoplasmata archaeon]
KRGIDPDNVTIPIVTSTVDFIGAGCLLSSFLVLQATLI